MRRPVPLLAFAALQAALLAAAPPAVGDEPRPRRVELSDELGVSSSPPTPTSPRATQVQNALDALVELSPGFAVTANLTAATLRPTPEVPGERYATRGATVWTVGAGLVWEIGDHLTLDGSAHLSPRVDLEADSTVAWVTATGVQLATDALLRSSSSSAGGTLAASYDTAGDSAAETALDLALSVEQYSTEQKITEIRAPRTGGTITAADLKAFCQTHPMLCPRQLSGALRGKPADLSQAALQLSVTETLWRDTDLGLAAGFYRYDKDPTEVGFFNLASAGRAGAGASFGGGVALAPLQWTIRPSVAQRLGDWTVRLSWQHGTYVSGEGTLDAVSAKVQVRLTRAFRMWLTAVGQRDQDGEGSTATSRTLALGALYRF